MLRLRVALLMRKKQRKNMVLLTLRPLTFLILLLLLALMAGEADLLPNFYWENYTLEHVCATQPAR
jgi:hypothetical protein